MGTQGASGSEDCPFCQIANNQTDAEILLSDDELLCFRDIKPSATHHYLVVSRTHINNCKTLQGDDIPLGQQSSFSVEDSRRGQMKRYKSLKVQRSSFMLTGYLFSSRFTECNFKSVLYLT
ncbi:histidine triad nucleotide-binding protein 3-like isoform X2 [Sander lucioperca]|uniref:histidine triad nucleotide-binding protein 3-like isoform X2 n=1 Tax=Sander lucioperca TaxID=283035 RepID=UPI00125D80CB|nr:histidine triad nucleotide-binding protein 3-like isoform X2 [Sander lucioperca]